MEPRQLSRQQIIDIAKQEYHRMPRHLRTLLADVVDLYKGRWSTHEACQVGYHTLDHALDVALAVARMIVGWNKSHPREPLPEWVFMVNIAAALFHDAGYIKEKGDNDGRGGKYTFSHVNRSEQLALHYLERKKWSKRAIDLVTTAISYTEFYAEPQPAVFDSLPDYARITVQMVATADLVSQMADVNYMARIHELYKEFAEGYGYEKPEELAAKGIQIFSSAREMIRGTLSFYEQFVLPRLHGLGRMDNYLVSFFSGDRNPYQENIALNLSGQLMANRTQWRQLGKILQQMGLVTRNNLQRAIAKQKKIASPCRQPAGHALLVDREHLLLWMNQEDSTDQLGEILLGMKAIDSVDLCHGLLNQLLSPELLNLLSRHELIFLLQVAMLLQNAHKGSRVLTTILEMTNHLLKCEASSILLADDEADEIVIAVPTGTHSSMLVGRRLPMDKGLVGWVYRHSVPATVNNVRTDDRFDDHTDDLISFVTRSVLAVPFHINGEWVGVIELLNKQNDQFTEHDMDILTILVNLIGSALANSLSLYH